MISDFVSQREVTLVCGSGGVGKTTLSALMGYAHARAGHKVAVLTVDPARRLRTALNLDRLGSEPVLVHSFPNGGELYALMLNSSLVWDELVSTYAGDRISLIQANRFYRSLKSNLAGASEFMAVELLYRLVSQKRFTSVIVDTAPTANSLEFLSAPERLAGFLDTRLYSLLKTISGKIPFAGLASRFLGGRQNILDDLIGPNALSDFSEFMQNFDSVRGALIEHSRFVEGLLSSHRTGMIVVGQADDRLQHDVETFLKSKISLDIIVLNRVRPYLMQSKYEEKVDDLWELIQSSCREIESQDDINVMQAVQRELFQAREEITIRRLVRNSYSTPVIEVPETITEKKGIKFLEILHDKFLEFSKSQRSF